MRLVFDTDIVVAGLRSAKGASRQLLLMALNGEVEMLLSVPLLIEYEAVLTRPEHLASSGASVGDVNAILDAMAASGEAVKLRFLWRPQLKDPADEMVLETAVNGHADCLVTFNLRHLGAAAKRFGIIARRPGEVLREIGGMKSAKK